MKVPTAVSLAVHVAVLSVFLVGARFHHSEPMGGLGPGDFIPVKMVGPEVLAAAAPAPQPPKPRPREPEPERVKAKPPELKPEKDPGIKLPDEAKKKPKAAADTVASAAEEAPRKAPAADSPATAALAGVPEATIGDGASVAAGMEGGEGGGGGGFGDFGYYRIAMQNRIAANWAPGFVSGETVCIVYFRIIRSGIVSGARIEQPSGIPFYDQTALRAVLESSPLPPLPAQFPADAVGVHFRFRYQP